MIKGRKHGRGGGQLLLAGTLGLLAAACPAFAVYIPILPNVLSLVLAVAAIVVFIQAVSRSKVAQSADASSSNQYTGDELPVGPMVVGTTGCLLAVAVIVVSLVLFASALSDLAW